MNRTVISLCLAVDLGCISAYGQSTQAHGRLPAGDDQLAALKALRIDAGTITLVEHDVSPTLTSSDGRAANNLPPRTIVKLVLNPAKGSNINVEIWLPDPDKWNGRLLGLGNGGAAGQAERS